MLVVSLFPLGVYWVITFNKTSDLVRESTEKFMAQTALGLGNHVDEWIDKNVRVLNAADGLIKSPFCFMDCGGNLHIT